MEGEHSAVLRAEDLTKSFGARKVLDSMSLTISEGETVVITGSNGSGKTTLLDVLSGHREADTGTVSLRNDGDWLSFCYPLPWWRRVEGWQRASHLASAGIRRVWQESRLFPSLTVGENVHLALACRRSTLSELILHPVASIQGLQRSKTQARDLLVSLGLSDREGSLGGSLSLGQEKRIIIARALASGGSIVLLDEPLAGLDGRNRERMLEFLDQFLLSKKSSAIIVEHLSVASPLLERADQTWRLQSGKLVVLSARTRSVDPVGVGQSTLEGFIPRAELACLRREEVDLPAGGKLVKLRHQDRGSPPRIAALSIRQLVVRRNGRASLGWRQPRGDFQGLSFDLKFGELGVLVAPNGWGKTTLLEAIAGLLSELRGEIRIEGRSVVDLPAWRRARMGIRLLGARNALFPRLTVAETLRLLNLPGLQDLDHVKNSRVGSLSGGERRRVSLWSIGESSICLADEPFSGLDEPGLKMAWNQLAPRPKRATLIVLPSHAKGRKDEHV